VIRGAATLVHLAVLAVLTSCHADAPPAALAPPANVAPPAPSQTCGSRTCTAGELCEDRYKGHGLDADGRPLGHRLCVPLPDACARTPTCACVTRELAATQCRDDGGRVYIDDYPRPR
jgi:hypothetical protein